MKRRLYLIPFLFLFLFFVCACDGVSTSKKYLVSYYVDGDLVESKLYSENAEIVLSPKKQDGSVFSGWYLDSGLTDGPYTSYTVTDQLSFYSKFIANYTAEQQEVIDLIDQIDLNNISASSSIIEEANRKYAALSLADRKAISNYATLERANQMLTDLINSEAAIVNDTIDAIYAMPYVVSYLDYDEIKPIITQYQSLSKASQEKVTNREYLEYVIEKYDSIEKSANPIIYPKYIYSNLDELRDDFSYAFYRFIDEVDGTNGLKQVGITNLTDFINYFKNTTVTNNKLASYLFNNGLSGRLNTTTVDKYIGYLYQNGMFKETLDSFIAIAIEQSALTGFFIDRNLTLDFIFKALNNYFTGVQIGGVVKNGLLLSQKVTGYYQEPTFVNKVTSGLRYAKVEKNQPLTNQLSARIVDAYLVTYANSDLSSSDVSIINNYYQQQTSAVKELITKYDYYWEKSYKTVYGVETANPSLNDAYVAELYAYYYQGTQINYDQYNYRRQINARAEDATKENYLFLDCSSYANAAFYNVFGQNFYGITQWENTLHTAVFIEYAMSNSYDYNLFSVLTSNYSSSTNRSNLINEIKNTLLPGDVLVYRKGTSVSSETGGHVMIYVGNNKFLHCTGTCMRVGDTVDPTTFTERQTSVEKSKGAICLDDWDIVFSTSGSRYLFSGVTRFAFFRPTAMNGLNISSESVNRYLNQNLSIEKSASVANLSSITKGSNLTYTVTVKNLTTSSTSLVNIKEVIPAGLTYVSSTNGGYYDASTRTIYWQIPSIAGSATTSVSYTAKVDNTVSHIEASQTTVNGIRTNTLHTYVVDNTNIAQVTSAVSSATGQTYSNPLKYVTNAYNNGVFASSTTCDNVMNSLFNYEQGNMVNQSSPYYKYLVGYTGYKTANYAIADNFRARAVKTSQLAEGDVIIIYNNYNNLDRFECYYYAGKTTIYGVTGDQLTIAYGTSSTVDSFLTTLYAYTSVVILRPTII